MKANGNDVRTWKSCSIGFSQRRQKDSSRSRPNATNFRAAVRGAFWKNQHVLASRKSGSQTSQSLSITLPRTVRVAGVVRPFNRNHTGEFQQAPQQRNPKEGMLRNGGQLTGKDGGHQHGIDEAARMPGDVQPATLRRKVLVVHDVHLSKPDVGQKAVETTNASVGERELVGSGIGTRTSLHGPTPASFDLENTPSTRVNLRNWFHSRLWVPRLLQGVPSAVSSAASLECTSADGPSTIGRTCGYRLEARGSCDSP